MIGNISRIKNFREAVNYLLKKEKQAIIIDTNLSGSNKLELIKELHCCSDLAKYRKRRGRKMEYPGRHLSIGFAESDGLIAEQKLQQIGREIIQGLGYSKNQYLIVKHLRTDPGNLEKHQHDHFHILINSLNWQERKQTQGVDKFEKIKLEKILRELEIKHQLESIESSHVKRYRGNSRQYYLYQQQAKNQEGEIKRIKKIEIQQNIEVQLKNSPELTDFLNNLKTLGIECKFWENRKEIPESEALIKDNAGISFGYQGYQFAGYQLGKDTTLPKLKKLYEREVRVASPEELPQTWSKLPDWSQSNHQEDFITSKNPEKGWEL